MRHTLAALYITLALSCLGASAAWAQSGTHQMAMPDELKWTDVPSLPAGAKIAVIEGPLNEAVPFTFRLKFPANYQIPAHWHPAIEHVTVISGTFHMGTGDKLDQSDTKALSAGSVAIMQPKPITLLGLQRRPLFKCTAWDLGPLPTSTRQTTRESNRASRLAPQREWLIPFHPNGVSGTDGPS